MITASSAYSGVPPLFASLSRTLSGDLDCSHGCLENLSTDGSPYTVRPQAVVYPRNTTDIKSVLAFSREYHIPLTVRGGGTAATGGSLGEGIVLDMTRYFTQIRQLNTVENTVTVDAGVMLEDLKEKLRLWGMEIPVLCGEDKRATAGGFVSTKSATASSFHTGTVREWVEGLTVILDTGEEHHIKDGITPSGRLLGIYQDVFPLLSESEPIIRAVRREESDDATGYFLWSTSIGPRQLLDQLVGSEGTLGIITSITFRVTPVRHHSANLLIPIPENGLQVTVDVARHHRSEAVYMFGKSYKDLWNRLRPNNIPGNLPDAARYIVLVFRDNDKHSLSSRVASFLRALPWGNGAVEIEKTLVDLLISFEEVHTLLSSYSQGNHVIATLGEGIIVSKHRYERCLQDLEKCLEETSLFQVVTGYAASGHISITSLIDAHSPSCEHDLLAYNERVCRVVEKFKGGLSAVGGDGLERTAYFDFIYSGAAIEMFSRIKQVWDPLKILNPGKKTGVPLDYLRKRVRKL
jgi:FAD/FMN-containing dehydrogenase